MASEALWPFSILLIVFSAANFHKVSLGLVCVNDFINNVTCSWNGTGANGTNCSIHGTKSTWVPVNGLRRRRIITRSCRLNGSGASPPGCSLVFQNQKFNLMDVSNISVECHGRLMEKLSLRLRTNIKMDPPDSPSVHSGSSWSHVSWRPSQRRSGHIHRFDFEVQTKLRHQTWKEARTFPTVQQLLNVSAEQLSGHCQVRVRVRPGDQYQNPWSDWSPSTSWTVAGETSQDQDQPLVPLMWTVVLVVVLLVAVLVFCATGVSRGRLKQKPLPNPSKYFPTLQSVPGGNLKNWLNPLSGSELFFAAPPGDHISPVELCDGWDAAPSPSSSTTALLHTGSFLVSAAPGSSGRGVADLCSSSSSSSCFSNMGYFMSSSSNGTVRTNLGAAHSNYQDEFQKHHPTLCRSVASTSSLDVGRSKTEPQSPDSGFGLGPENKDGDQVSVVHLVSPLTLLLPEGPPSLSSVRPLLDAAPVTAAGVSYTAWPAADTMYRSSSMPAEPCKPGYLTLKDLQTTFSNKSI